jgi:hypothetical protein
MALQRGVLAPLWKHASTYRRLPACLSLPACLPEAVPAQLQCLVGKRHSQAACAHTAPCHPACLLAYQPAVAFAAHTVNAARYPVAQPSFDRLLKAQLGGISDLEVSKAKAIALPIAYATLEER